MARDRPSPYGNPGRFFYRQPVRALAIPNYGFLQGLGTARDRPSPYGEGGRFFS